MISTVDFYDKSHFKKSEWSPLRLARIEWDFYSHASRITLALPVSALNTILCCESSHCHLVADDGRALCAGSRRLQLAEERRLHPKLCHRVSQFDLRGAVDFMIMASVGSLLLYGVVDASHLTLHLSSTDPPIATGYRECALKVSERRTSPLFCLPVAQEAE